MKILFITTEGFDTPGPSNQMAMVMINDFLYSGFNVHLIQSKRKCINSEIPQLLYNKKNFTYDIVNRKVIDKTRFIHRYIDEASFAITSFKKWKKVKDVDIVFLQSCPTVIYQLILLKLFINKPIIYNIYDVFPGHAYDIGVIKSKFIYIMLQFVQRLTYKMADIITVLSEDMKQKVIEQGAYETKVRVVPAWYDDKAVKEIPISENLFIKKYNINTDKFYVQFAGTIGYILNYHTIIELAKKLLIEPNIIIQIVGDGTVKDQFIKKSNEVGLTNILFYPLQPLEIVADVYSVCNIGIIPLKKGVIGNGVPSKAPLLMACRRVIVNSVESNSEYFKMFNDNDIGISVDINDIDTLAEKIIYLYKNPLIINRMANNAKIFSAANFTSTLNTGKFIDIFNENGDKKNKNTKYELHKT